MRLSRFPSMTDVHLDRRRHLRWWLAPAAAGLAASLGGCAALLPHRDPVKVDLAGIDGLPGEGIELRFLVKLRVQNPNDLEISYDGLAFEIELRGASFASGVSPAAGTVPRFGAALISVPVTVSGLSMARQLFSLAREANQDKLPTKVPYVLRGKLGGGLLGTFRFETKGEVDLGHAKGA